MLYILLMLIITWKTKNRKTEPNFLSCFSLSESFKSLFEIDSSSLDYLKPLRATLYLGLVFYHSIFIRAVFPSTNSEKILKFEESAFSKTVSTFPFGLTVFFVISSMLTTLKILRLLDKYVD